jgi:hypothetical protein
VRGDSIRVRFDHAGKVLCRLPAAVIDNSRRSAEPGVARHGGDLPASPPAAAQIHTARSDLAVVLQLLRRVRTGQISYRPLLDRFGSKPPHVPRLLLYIAASLGYVHPPRPPHTNGAEHETRLMLTYAPDWNRPFMDHI